MWDNDKISFISSRTHSLDSVLSTSISDLTAYGRKYSAGKRFVEGSRVVSHTNNGIIIPGQIPKSGTKGTIVSVETPDGNITSLEGGAFVRFDGRDRIDRVPSEFLRLASMKKSSLDDFIVLSGPSLMSIASESGPTLVHKSTKDLWSVRVSEDGSYDVERLFDDSGEPLKI